MKRKSSPRIKSLESDPDTSKRMAGIRQQGTSAELVVRKVAWSLGLRYRVNNRELAGSPDLANRSKKWAVFVHGCFWHRHKGCARTTTPKRNRAFWVAKFDTNVERDRRVVERLRRDAWTVVIVWECEALRRPKTVEGKLSKLVTERSRRKEKP